MKRRALLHQTAALIAAPAFGQVQEPVASRIIDTHTHFYDPMRSQGVPWPPKDSPLHRRVMPQDWLALAEPHGCRETVIVEASPWVEDNQWILDLAAEEKCIVGFCGNLDPLDEDFTKHVKRFAAHRLFRGVRWRAGLVQVVCSDERVRRGAHVLAEHDLQLDLNGPPAVLLEAAKLAAEVPELRMVIDHVGGARDPQALKPEWKPAIEALAKHANVFMKVSGMPEQVKSKAGTPAPREVEYYQPVLDHLWQCFGEDRLLFGSNWPVSDLGAPYDAVMKLVSAYFRSKGREACEKYFWRNSLAAYKWQSRA
jgi:L-fuconolactonase